MHKLSPVIKTDEKIRCNRLTGLSLQRDQVVTFVNQHINLVAGEIPPEIMPVFLTIIQIIFKQLRDNVAFKNIAALGMYLKVFVKAYLEEVAQKAGINKINFGRFNQTRIKIFKMRTQKNDQKA